MTEKRFDLIEYMLKKKSWDFFLFVEIGIDRLHHAFWRYIDPQHRWHDSKSPLRDPILKYYSYIDRRIGAVLELLDDETVVIAASDHGAKGMKGIFCLNEWLVKEGYLALRSRPDSVCSIEKADVDWERTRVWAWGGYCGKIFLNIKGREPQGIVDSKEVETLKKELSEKFKSIKDDKGETMATLVVDPTDAYEVVKGDPPDLMVFLDDLYWRATGNLG
jgi:predicted AlkP superfamily phosphohydrolase/phosphomutase